MNRGERRAGLNRGEPLRRPRAAWRPAELALLLDEAVQHHQASRVERAEALYRRLAVNPNHAQSLHLLGLAAHQDGRHEAAAELIRWAIAINGAVPEFHDDLGSVFQLLGRYDKAASRTASRAIATRRSRSTAAPWR